MECVFACSMELNKKIIESETYKNYLKTKEELNKFPKYKDMVDRFRRKQVDFEARKINGGLVDLNEEFALSNEYADICLIAPCNDFFYAEMQMLEMLKKVYSNICAGLNIDMAFMESFVGA